MPVRRRFTAALVLVAAAGAAASVGSVDTISVTPTGAVGNGTSSTPDVSADGRFVVFESTATNLLGAAGASVHQVFLRDRQAQTTELVSKGTSGTAANDYSALAAVTPDGRYAVFESLATNLVTGDANGKVDIFLRDRQLGTTERISVSSTGGDADDNSQDPAISDDGRFVAFDSDATNLVAGETGSGLGVYVRDRQSGTTERISRGAAGEPAVGSQHPQISADGRIVAFRSSAANLVAKDTNGTWDIFVHDRATRRTERVSVSGSGKQANAGSNFPRISADGRFVVFESEATNLGVRTPQFFTSVFLHDRALNRTEVISVALNGAVANLQSYEPSVSGDGRVVTFKSQSTNIAANPTGLNEVYARDRQTGITERVSVTNAGGPLDDRSEEGRVSRDGGTIAFSSVSTTLAANDTNGAEDVFARPLTLPAAAPAPVANAGPDRDVAATGKKTKVTLDASASTDPTSSPLKFAWMENGKKIAAGAHPKVKLTVGAHSIWLVATNRKKLVGADEVLVSVAH